MRHLVAYWKIPDMSGLSGEAAEAQQYLCGLAAQYERLSRRVEGRREEPARTPLSWIFDRPV